MKYTLFLLAIFCAMNTFAQEKNKSTSGMNKPKFVRRDITYLFPEFYSYWAKHDKDTTWKFECYDVRDSIMNIDTVNYINEVRYFSLFKSYTDSAHTYKDSNGEKQLLPVSSIIQRYDRAGKDKWISIDYSRNKYTELKEFTGDIVRADTVTIIDPFTGKEQFKYYKYYKVAVVK